MYSAPLLVKITFTNEFYRTIVSILNTYDHGRLCMRVCHASRLLFLASRSPACAATILKFNNGTLYQNNRYRGLSATYCTIHWNILDLHTTFTVFTVYTELYGIVLLYNSVLYIKYLYYEYTLNKKYYILNIRGQELHIAKVYVFIFIFIFYLEFQI